MSKTTTNEVSLSQRTALVGLAANGAVLAAPHVARAQSVGLKMGSFVGPSNPLNTVILDTRAQKLNSECDGALNIELVAGGASPKPDQVLESVAAGIVDMAWGVPA